jgi:hypothetical protein
MKTLHKYTITTFILGIGFLLHQFNQKIQGYILGLIDSYFDALLCIPFVLYLIGLSEYLIFHKPLKSYSLQTVIGTTLFFIVVFEWLAPVYLQIGISDYIDILLYLIGAVLYLYINHYFIFKDAKQNN